MGASWGVLAASWAGLGAVSEPLGVVSWGYVGTISFLIYFWIRLGLILRPKWLPKGAQNGAQNSQKKGSETGPKKGLRLENKNRGQKAKRRRVELWA